MMQMKWSVFLSFFLSFLREPLRVAAVLAVAGGAVAFLALRGGPLTAEETDPWDEPYEHPLKYQTVRGGLVPLYDVKDDEQGRRYAIGDSMSEDEDGNVQTFSGVFTLERRAMTAEDRAERVRMKAENGEPETVEAVPVPAPVIGEVLADKMKEVDKDEPLLVLVRLAKPQEPTMMEKLDRALALGEIETKRDYFQKKMEFLLERQAKVAQVQKPVVQAIEDLGGEVVGLCQNMYCLNARLRPTDVTALSQRGSVSRMDLDLPLVDDDVTGTEIVQGHQIDQFLDNGWDGERSESTSSDDLVVGQVESGAPDDEHVAFRDSSLLGSRIITRYDCNTSPCTYHTNWDATTWERDHATGVATSLIADLMDGQDSTITTTAEREARSGYAREARLASITAGYNSTATSRAFDQFISLAATYDLPVVNMSATVPSDDDSCLGQSVLNQNANDLYEDGILLVKSAGNTYHGSTTDCTIGSPGSAAGVFTVGNSLSTAFSGYCDGNQEQVRNAEIAAPSTARGGCTYAEGRNRTIVDLAAYGNRFCGISNVLGLYECNECWGGTSHSAPVVSGTAISFIDWYRDAKSNFINNPGALFSNMLAMGDRFNQNGTKNLTGYDNLLGAGRMKMRRWDADGLDGYSLWATFATCIQNGEVLTFNANGGNPLPADVDVIKAVVYWYDPGHQSDSVTDNVDMELRRISNNTLIRGSYSDWDNKERIFVDDDGSLDDVAVKLVLRGESITTADASMCNGSGIQVWVTWFFEDSDRDDGGFPAWDAATGIGVEPEDI